MRLDLAHRHTPGIQRETFVVKARPMGLLTRQEVFLGTPSHRRGSMFVPCSQLALAGADRGYVLEIGRIVHGGTACELIGDPAVKRA